MAERTLIERITYRLSVVVLAVAVAGNDNACLRKSYKVGSQSNVQGTGTPTPEGTGTDVTKVTATPVSTRTFTPTPTRTISTTLTVLPTTTFTATPTKSGKSAAFLRGLGELKNETEAPDHPAAKSLAGATGSGGSGSKSRNWLGKAFVKGNATPDTAALDTDGDGYTDAEEVAAGTDPNDPRSHPSAHRQDPITEKLTPLPND